EGQLARGHFVEDDTEREEVAAPVEFAGADLLRGHVGDGADGAAGTREVFGVHKLRRQRIRTDGCLFPGTKLSKPKIKNFGVAALGDEDVGGLDVAMDDALSVSGIKSVRYFAADIKKYFHVERAAHDDVLQGPAVETVHGDKGIDGFFGDY